MKNIPDIPNISVRFLLPFFAANGLIYGLNSIYYSFIPKYLKDFADKSDADIGIILSVGPLIGIIALIFFGIVSDRAKYKNNILTLIIVISAVLFYMVQLNNSLVYLVIIFAVFMFFLSPFGGLIDAVSLEYTTSAKIKYGPIRVMGSLCFGIFSLILTLILTFFGKYTDVRIIFPVFAVMALFAIISVKMIPPVKGHARGKKKFAYKEFFKDKVCITLLVCMFVGHFSFGCYNNFMQNFLDINLHQAPWVWGLTVFLTIAGEIVFFIKFDYFFKKFSIKSIVVFCIITQVLRYFSFAFFPYSVSILITSLLTGSFCTIINYAAAYYINLTVKKEMLALGQTLLYAISFYIPRFLSGIFGGFAVEKFGFGTLMMICGVINLILLFSTKFMPFRDPT